MAAKLRKQIRIWRNWDIGDRFACALAALKRGDRVTMQWHLDRAEELRWLLNSSVPF